MRGCRQKGGLDLYLTARGCDGYFWPPDEKSHPVSFDRTVISGFSARGILNMPLNFFTTQLNSSF